MGRSLCHSACINNACWMARVDRVTCSVLIFRSLQVMLFTYHVLYLVPSISRQYLGRGHICFGVWFIVFYSHVTVTSRIVGRHQAGASWAVRAVIIIRKAGPGWTSQMSMRTCARQVCMRPLETEDSEWTLMTRVFLYEEHDQENSTRLLHCVAVLEYIIT